MLEGIESGNDLGQEEAKKKATRGTRWGFCSKRRSRGDRQEGPSPSPAQSQKKEQWIWLATSPNGIPSRSGSKGHIFSSLRKLTCPRTLWLQRSPGRTRKACGLFRSPQHGKWMANKQKARSKGVVVAAALRHGLSTLCGGAGDRSIELCKGARARFLPQWHSMWSFAYLSLHAHSGRAHPENWQILSTIGHWLTSLALPIIGGDFPVEPEQLEDSVWVLAVGVFVVAPKLATVTPSHIDFFVVSRDLVGRAKRTRRFRNTLLQVNQSAQLFPRGCSTKEACHGQAQGLTGGQAEWVQEAGERPGLGPGAQAVWTSFIDAVEEGRSSQGQKLVWQARNKTRCTHEVQSWQDSVVFASTFSVLDSGAR